MSEIRQIDLNKIASGSTSSIEADLTNAANNSLSRGLAASNQISSIVKELVRYFEDNSNWQLVNSYREIKQGLSKQDKQFAILIRDNSKSLAAVAVYFINKAEAEVLVKLLKGDFKISFKIIEDDIPINYDQPNFRHLFTGKFKDFLKATNPAIFLATLNKNEGVGYVKIFTEKQGIESHCYPIILKPEVLKQQDELTLAPLPEDEAEHS